MSDAQAHSINFSTDYYKILSIPRTATQDEIKAAYLQLGSSEETLNKFKDIQEAFSLLSKPDIRYIYDSKTSPKPAAFIPNSGFTRPGSAIENNAQISNFASVTSKTKSGHWLEIQDKYKTEKWAKLSLADKKLSRLQTVKPLSSAMGTIGIYLAGSIAMSLIGYSVLRS